MTDHIEELASLLTGLDDKFEMDKFQEMRLQGMIAILVAKPLEMGQWFSRILFEGDYSIGQRASVLNTLGMGAREVAGYGNEDGALTGAAARSDFPSKQLPSRLHKIYTAQTSPLDALASGLEKKMIEPMAVQAADKLSGPNVLKVRTFSSRMAVEKKTKRPEANALAKIAGTAFFFPLTGRWWVQTKT